MKFMNLFIISLSSANLVLSNLTDMNQCQDKLCYLISNGSGGTATVTGFSAKYADSKVADIPASVNIKSNIFRINSIDRLAFSELKNLQEVNIASGISDLTLSYGAFSKCPNLKRVVFDNQSFTIEDLSTFTSPNRDITFLGKGVKNYTDNQIKIILAQLGMKASKYSDLYDYQRKVDIFNVAKNVSQYHVSDNADGDNAIVITKIGYGSDAGRARLFRLLAIAKGINPNDILIATDGNGKYWNFIKVDNYWYNASVNYPFRFITEYHYAEWKRPFFLGNKDFMKEEGITASPSQWRVVFTNYGYQDELRGQQAYDLFDNYLNQVGGNRKE